MRKILIVVDAPGPAEFLAPALEKLRKKKLEIKTVTVKDSPTKILTRFKPLRCDNEAEAEKIYKNYKPDLLVVGISSLILGPYVNVKIAELARQDKKPVIAFQDIWANHRWPMNVKMLKYCDAVLTIDEMAEHLLRQDGYKGKVIVTGSPAFDRLRSVNVQKERARLRKKLKLSERNFVILYTGTGTPQSWKEDENTFNFLAAAIRKLKIQFPKLVFFATPHPRDQKPDRYHKLAPDLKLPKLADAVPGDHLVPMADVVVGMYSTALVHACYLRIPGISILLPNGGLRRLKKIHLPDFPPNAVDATIGIYKNSVRELASQIEKIATDPIYRAIIKKSQTQFFPFYKEPAAKKIENLILTFSRISE